MNATQNRATRMQDATAPTGHPHPLLDDAAREHPADDETITYKAAAVFVANAAYKAALEACTPSKTLDNMCDALPEVMPKVVRIVNASPELAENLRADIAARLWAYTAIEYSRVEAGDGYGYLFDLLAESLQKGANPHAVRRDALAAPRRIRELCEQAAEPPAEKAPAAVMLGTTQCCARRPDRDQLDGRRLDGREDTDETFNDRLLCTEQHGHDGDHRDSLGRTWARVPAEVTR